MQYRALSVKYVIPIDSNFENVLENYTVVINGHGRIAKILPTANFSISDYPECNHIKYNDNSVLMPGFINCHTHCGMTLLRGYSDDEPLLEWLTDHIWPTEGHFLSNKFDDEFGHKPFIRIGTTLAIEELFRTGTTTVLDMYFSPESSNPVFSSAGMRVFNGFTVLDRRDDKLLESVEAALSYASNLELWKEGLPETQRDFVNSAIMAHAAYTVPEIALKALSEGNSKSQLFHMHLHETLREVEDFQTFSGGKSAVHILDEAGILNEKFIGAHCVHLTDSEIDLFASRRASVAHCPRSNLKLGSGIASVQKMLNKGINVALGTDSSASNNCLDMLCEVQTAAMVGKVGYNGDCQGVTAFTALKMATINGARALGIETDVGSITEGKIADIQVLELTSQRPIFCVTSELVYGGSKAAKVIDVYTSGVQRVRDGSVIGMKIDWEEVNNWHKHIQEFRQRKAIKIHS